MVSRPNFKHVRLFVVPALVVAGTLVGGGGASAGSAVFGVDYFISPPLVQGSYVTGPSETFNGLGNSASCPATIAGGLIGVSGACKTLVQDGAGGAKSAANDSTPTVGESGSDYASTSSGGEMTFTMPEPQKYLGFWWSAGSGGNTVRFFSGDTEVLSLSTDDLTGLLGTMPTLADYGTTGSITSQDGNSTYVKHHYFGNPRGVSGAGSPPVMTSALWAANTTNYVSGGVTYTEPFVYLHVFGQGGMSFDRITFSGWGFEFDNFVVSPLSQTPRGSLVRIGSVTGTPPPDFQPEGQAPEFDGPTLEHYQERSELPDTGGASTNLMWFGAALVLIGIGSNPMVRRLLRE